MRLFPLILIAISFLNGSSTSAAALEGPTCTVTAQVVDKGVEMRQLRGINDDISEYESEFLKVEILKTKRAVFLGNCDFVEKGDIFKINAEDSLKLGDEIEAGLEAGGAMTPSGDVSSFIHWEPVSLVSPDRDFPSYMFLQSSDEPEKKGGHIEKEEQEQEEVVIEEETPENLETVEPIEAENNNQAIETEIGVNELEALADDQAQITPEETVVEKEHNIVLVVAIVFLLVTGLRLLLRKRY